MQQPPGGYGPPQGGYGPPQGGQPPGGYGPPAGYGPPGAGGYGPPPGPPPKKGMSTAGIILLVLVILMALGGGGCALCVCLGAKGIADQQSAEDQKNAEAKRNPVRVPLSTLLKEYKDNEVRADGQYKGKYVEVSGKVNDVKKDLVDHMYITIGTGQSFQIPQVQCYFDDKQKARATTLSKGNPVSIRGRVEGLIFNVQLKDCEFL